MRRRREPRPFYRDVKIIRDYNFLHAQVYNRFPAGSLFFGAFECTDPQNHPQILVITSSQFYSLDSDLQTLWFCQTGQLARTDYIQKPGVKPGVVFSFGSQQRFQFDFATTEQLEECKTQLEELKHFVQ